MARSSRSTVVCTVLVLAAVLLLVPAALAGAASGSASAARSIGAYYSSYGHPAPIPARTVAAGVSDGPGWTLAIVGGVVLIAVAAGAGLAVGRSSVHSRRVTV